MAFIEITSTDKENFSWVLEKNPETQEKERKPFSKRLRKGVVFGWYGQSIEHLVNYNLWFKDSDNEVSFSHDTQFEYLDQTRYSHPHLISMMLDQVLRSALYNENEKDANYHLVSISTSLMVFSLSVFEKTIKSLNRDSNIEIQYTPIYGNPERLYYGYSVKLGISVKGDYSLRKALSVLMCIAMFQALMDRGYTEEINEDRARKFIKVLNFLAVDYYPRYLFSSRLIKSPKMFDSIKDELQGSGMLMNFGDSGVHRRDALLSLVQKLRTADMDVVDVGCAELFNSYYLHRKTNCNIVAIDKDTELMENNQRFIERKKIEDHFTLVPVELTADWIKSNSGIFEGQFVIMTEVIEHMALEDATRLVEAIISTRPKYLYITTPNRLFNRFYEMDEGQMRHDDHNFEMDDNEFKKWMNAFTLMNSQCEFAMIGDSVGGIYSSQSAFITFN